MKVISYTDPNGKKGYANVENFVCTMTDRTPMPPDAPKTQPEWITKIMLNPAGGYTLALEDVDTINDKIQKALGVDWSNV
tara:strand:+ start:27565 stop:27804 length:240 start_codon:yes stop_codon:yes gene_type:complete